jgi:hypothetical protein
MKANVRKQKRILNDMMQEAAKAKELPPELDLEEQLRAAGFTKLANMEKKMKRLLSSEGMDAIERKYSRL